MENWTPLGIAGATLGILYFIVRYFVKALEHKDALNMQLTDKFIEIAQENTEARVKLTQAIDANTQMTKVSNEISKQNADMMTKLVVEAVKKE